MRPMAVTEQSSTDLEQTNCYDKYDLKRWLCDYSASIVLCSRVYLAPQLYSLLCWFLGVMKNVTQFGTVLSCDGFVILCRSDCLRLCYYWAKWRLRMIIIGGKDAGHSCMLPYRLGCFESTIKCGAVPTQWLPVTTSFCLSKTVKITPIILSALGKAVLAQLYQLQLYTCQIYLNKDLHYSPVQLQFHI